MNPFDKSGVGILEQIRGEHIVRAASLLPPAMAEEDTHASVEVDVPGIGRVRIAFELRSALEGGSRRWFWVATRAELA